MTWDRFSHRMQWDFPLGPVFGAAGTQTTIVVTPQCHYRVEKVVATDTSTPPGTGTAVVQFLVGQQLQRPAVGGASLAVFFGPAALGNGVRWGVCEPAFSIALTISFIETGTFHGALFGSASL